MKRLYLGLFMLLLLPAAGQEIYRKWFDQIDPAAERALAYLAREQKPDGSFPDAYGNSCGIPALAGMAWLSKGYLPTDGPYATELNRVIDYLLKHQNDDGVFEGGEGGAGPMYSHTIATLFLSEVSGMTDEVRQEKVAKALKRALSLILRAQAVKKPDKDQGGWRYHPNSRDSDTSCSGWALMALKSARLNGAAVPDAAIREALDYLYRHFHPQEGHFGYTMIGANRSSLTGMGLLCLELCGRHGRPETLLAGDYVLDNLHRLQGNPYESYANYYNAQAMFQLGGSYWKTYADWMYQRYLKLQGEDGSWHAREGGRIYGTAITTLAFTVPYRQLPIYQRDEE